MARDRHVHFQNHVFTLGYCRDMIHIRGEIWRGAFNLYLNRHHHSLRSAPDSNTLSRPKSLRTVAKSGLAAEHNTSAAHRREALSRLLYANQMHVASSRGGPKVMAVATRAVMSVPITAQYK